jgi:hypothetical protein
MRERCPGYRCLTSSSSLEMCHECAAEQRRSVRLYKDMQEEWVKLMAAPIESKEAD